MKRATPRQGRRSSSSTLVFNGPFPLCDLRAGILGGCRWSETHGLYIWAVAQTSGQYRITYVGLTTQPFRERMKQHVIQMLGGNYRVHDVDALRRGKAVILWDGLWRQRQRHKTHLFLSHYAELAPAIRREVRATSVFLAPCVLPREHLARIESQIAGTLRGDPALSALLPCDVRYSRRYAGSVPMHVKIRARTQLSGFPMQFDA